MNYITFSPGWLFLGCRTIGEILICPQYMPVVADDSLDPVMEALFSQPHPEARKLLMLDWRAR